MNFLDKQISETRDNYNYFFIKLIFSIFKNIFKLSIILLLVSIFNYTVINVIAIIYTVYCFYNIISISKYYFNIIKDIKDTAGYEDFSFEINANLLYNGIFNGEIKYGR